MPPRISECGAQAKWTTDLPGRRMGGIYAGIYGPVTALQLLAMQNEFDIGIVEFNEKTIEIELESRGSLGTVCLCHAHGEHAIFEKLHVRAPLMSL